MATFVEDFSKDIDQELTDGRLDAPAARRNHEVIGDVLETVLERDPVEVLEIGSGTGQHALLFTQRFENLIWRPSDPLQVHRDSIDAWRGHAGIERIFPAVEIDAVTDWGLAEVGDLSQGDVGAVYSANVIHIAPWEVAVGIIRGASRVLGDGGLLIFYGPFSRDGDMLSDGNRNFDAALRSRDESWGVRDVSQVIACGLEHGFEQAELFDMPSNNTILVLRKV